MHHRCTVVLACGSLFTPMTFSPARATAASCENLTTLSLPDSTIISAKSVAADGFSPPTDGVNSTGADPQAITVPAFCRVIGRVPPAINFEVWMPVAGWNGKFQGVGNGGFAGLISYAEMAAALNRGYATASTDTGHVGENGRFALGHPELVVDFGHRAIHEMTLKAKAIVEAFYGSAPQRSYFVGCSTGGRQGLMEAQRYPGDYDGIVAGAAVAFYGHFHAGQLWVASATLKDPASAIPPDKYSLIHKAVLAACDARDGVTDGVLEDPRRCDFDPKTLLCVGTGTGGCLTAAQIEAVRKIYEPARNPRTGQEIYPAMPPGGELGWLALAGGPEPPRRALELFRYFVFEDPNWDWRTFDFDRDLARTDAKMGPLVAMNPDLREFKARGGKLIMYHGWNDQSVAPENSVNYYESVSRLLGAKQTDQFLRLFMAPGMQHCRGGPVLAAGPDMFDELGAVEQWVEQGHAPEKIIASHSIDGVVDRTRPLCPYPQIAKYKGTGSTDEAANFVCATPAPSRK
jgi:tannase/feruloyl esterase